MKNIIIKYHNGDRDAKEELIESIMSMYNDDLTREEAIILLYKKYGKVEIL